MDSQPPPAGALLDVIRALLDCCASNLHFSTSAPKTKPISSSIISVDIARSTTGLIFIKLAEPPRFLTNTRTTYPPGHRCATNISSDNLHTQQVPDICLRVLPLRRTLTPQSTREEMPPPNSASVRSPTPYPEISQFVTFIGEYLLVNFLCDVLARHAGLDSYTLRTCARDGALFATNVDTRNNRCLRRSGQ